MKTTKCYPIEKSCLYRLRNRRKLENILGLKHKSLINVDSLIRYSDFPQRKSTGKVRVINNPENDLKNIQKKLLLYLRRIEKPKWLLSQKGNSYIDNARFHIGSSYVLTVDIKEFYNNCTENKIFELFRHIFRMAPDIATILCKIVTYDGKLPTGAPTSQIIAYWAYSKMFEQIKQLSIKHECAFSLYVDDMTFSSEKPIPLRLIYEINSVLKKHGHSLKMTKIKKYNRRTNKLITGAVIDKSGILRVPNKLRQKIITDLEKLKQNELTGPAKMRLVASLIGRINCSRNIEPGIFPEALCFVKKQVKILKRNSDTT